SEDLPDEPKARHGLAALSTHRFQYRHYNPLAPELSTRLGSGDPGKGLGRGAGRTPARSSGVMLEGRGWAVKWREEGGFHAGAGCLPGTIEGKVRRDPAPGAPTAHVWLGSSA